MSHAVRIFVLLSFLPAAGAAAGGSFASGCAAPEPASSLAEGPRQGARPLRDAEAAATATDADDEARPHDVSTSPDAGAPHDPRALPALPHYDDWPRVVGALRADPAQEAWIAARVATMTLAQKVGQMTQAEVPDVTADDVRSYYLGSVLSGAGAWPVTRTGRAGAWVALADALWEGSSSTDMETPIPLMFAVDAVHGNQKQFGATLFPHNIGLGATRDPELVARIGAFTAQQLRVSGLDYTFAPCVAVPADDRWGRTYEGFSEHPAITRMLANALTRGLVAPDPNETRFHGVITSAKHFIGDGSTERGIDQGVSQVSEQTLINVHAQGYYGAIEAGNQTIMASYSSWVEPDGTTRKVHGSKYLLTTVLKEKMGFDGMVITDYRGMAQVPGCTSTRCAAALNAGIDMVMIPDAWRTFIDDTIALVESGEVPIARIDDAVTRILRVKLRAGLFDAPRPSARPDAGDESRLIARELGREAVRKSAVLLKNERNVLPLDPGLRVLVVGKSADSLPNQNGGWSLGWQGVAPVDDLSNASFPNGQTLLAGIRARVGEDRVQFSPTAADVDVGAFDVVIAAIGETPYAEFGGDIVWNPLVTWGPTEGRLPADYPPKQTLEHAVRNPEDLAVLDAVAGRGVPVVTVFLSGRPLHTNKEINRSDAFVAGWLPGTEAGALAEVLFRGDASAPGYDFQGRLSYSWPRHPCQTVLNEGMSPYQPLFPLGHGLRYDDASTLPPLDESPGPSGGCVD